MTYQIQSGVAKPQPPEKKAVGGQKYPADKLAVNDFFVVPKSEMEEGDTPTKFRNRVNNAVRSYKQRANKARTMDADYDPNTFVPLDFSIILLGEPQNSEQKWQEGDVGVWRDA